MSTKMVGRPVIEISDEQIIDTFKKYNGSLRKCANDLGISHMTFKRRIEKLSIKKKVTIEIFLNGSKL